MRSCVACGARTPSNTIASASHYIRDTIPGVTLATDIIVGFPGETDEQFESTLRLLDDLEFDKVHVAMYSPASGDAVRPLGRRYPGTGETCATSGGRTNTGAGKRRKTAGGNSVRLLKC